MNFDTIRPRNERENLLHSKAENCETLLQQTQTKQQETLEFRPTKLRENFSLKPPIYLCLDSN